MALALITGANRGIGLEFARQYAGQGWDVIGACRHPKAAKELVQIGAETVKLDVTEASDVTALSRHLAGRVVDLFVCNAGVTGTRTPVLTATTQADFDYVMRTNVLGPMWLTAALADHIPSGGKAAFLSSRMGSIGAMANAGSALYRASKAALNAIVKAASLELKQRGVTVIALHPGWVKTGMGGAGADIDAVKSVSGMRAVIERAGERDSGRFFDYSGEELPW